MKPGRVRIYCAPSTPTARETTEEESPRHRATWCAMNAHPTMRGHTKRRHCSGADAGEGRGRKGLVSGGGGVDGVPGGGQDVLVAGQGRN